MKLKRTWEGQLSRKRALLLCLGCVFGCTAYPTLKSVPLDCTADSGYQFLVIDNLETVGPAQWVTAGDMTSAAAVAEVDAIPGGRCNSTAALVLRSSHHNDWGSLFGFNNFGPRDASAYEGLSFWSRAPTGTTPSFSLLLDDPNTSNPIAAVCDVDGGAPTSTPDSGPTQVCKNYCVPDAGVGAPSMTVYDPATGMAISGSTTAAPPPDSCGNGYAATQVVASDWRFYTIPFARFQQGYMPNRVPNPVLKVTGAVPDTGLRTAALMNFIIRLPKEAEAELWIDNLAFYRKKAAAADTDGGLDAR